MHGEEIDAPVSVLGHEFAVGQVGQCMIRRQGEHDLGDVVGSWPKNRVYRYRVVQAPSGEPWVLFNGRGTSVQSANPRWFGARFEVVDLDRLLEVLRLVPEPSPREREEQALGFAHDYFVGTSNRPQRAAFRALALDRYGWTDAEFSAWADRREWR